MMRESVFRRIRSPAFLLKKKKFARTVRVAVLANSFFTGNSAPMCF